MFETKRLTHLLLIIDQSARAALLIDWSGGGGGVLNGDGETQLKDIWYNMYVYIRLYQFKKETLTHTIKRVSWLKQNDI